MYTDTRYSPDGRLITTTARDVQFWDAATGKPVGPLLQHDKNAAGVAFHPGGRLLFTCGFDLILRAWDVPTAVVGDVEQLVLWTRASPVWSWALTARHHDLDDQARQRRRERLHRLGSPEPEP